MSKKSFFHLFKMDAARWLVPEQIGNPDDVTPIRLVKLLLHHMPLRAMLLFRLGSWCKQRRIPFLPGFLQRQIYRRYGLEISPGADIGGGLYVAQPIGTVISVRRMGINCSLIAAITIGMRNTWAFPDIGDHVFIGAGARVLGDITLGDRCLVGANAVVIKDVPPGATAVGIPAKILSIPNTQ